RRVIVIGEREAVPGIEPVDVGVETAGGRANVDCHRQEVRTAPRRRSRGGWWGRWGRLLPLRRWIWPGLWRRWGSRRRTGRSGCRRLRRRRKRRGLWGRRRAGRR